MPASYAHYRFGQAVFSRLPVEKQKIIQAHSALYDLGLQGPDLLFHSRPLSHDPGLPHYRPLVAALHPAPAPLLSAKQFCDRAGAPLFPAVAHPAGDRP